LGVPLFDTTDSGRLVITPVDSDRVRFDYLFDTTDSGRLVIG
jgi:hypothetical protein